MVLNSKATKWLAVDIVLGIIFFILWMVTDGVVSAIFKFLTGISGLSLLIIPYIAMNKEEQKKGKEEYRKAMKREQEKKLTEGYKCPSCGMMAGHKISAVSKTVSVGILGLASDKIGKNYKCDNCGYEW